MTNFTTEITTKVKIITINEKTLPKLGLYSYTVIDTCTLPLIIQKWNVWEKTQHNVILPKDLTISNSDLGFGQLNFVVTKYNWSTKLNETIYPISLESGESFVKEWGWFATITRDILNNTVLFEPFIDINNGFTFERLLFIKMYNQVKQDKLEKILKIGGRMREIRNEGFEDTAFDLREIKSQLEEIKDIDYDIITSKIEETIKEITESLNKSEVSEDHRYFRGCFIYDFSIYHEQFLANNNFLQ